MHEPSTPSPMNDPRVLRAIAHPVRSRILDELSASGSVRATDVARVLGIPTNQASFHLRQLAKYGLVEESPEGARDKRDRVWRSSSPQGFSVRPDDLAQTAGGTGAVEVFRQSKLAALHAVVERAFAREHEEGDGVFATSMHALKLTDEEAHQLRTEIDDVVSSWSRRTRGGDPQRRSYRMVQIVQPLADDEPLSEQPRNGTLGR